MQTKVNLWATPKSAAGFAEYMEDLLHPNHASVLISSRYIGCEESMELQLAIAAAAFEERPIQRGRRLTTCAVEVEGSTPKEIELTPAERQLVEKAIVEKLRLTMCLFTWHSKRPRNKRKWREDFHLLTPNRDLMGRPLTARASGNLMQKVRAIVDRVHREINQARRRNDQQHIPTMPEIRDKQRNEGRAILVRKLAEASVSLTPLNIVDWLRTHKMLGVRRPKTDDYEASVSVLYPPSGRPRRERLKPLIDDIRTQRQQLEPDRKSRVQAAKALLSPIQQNVKSK